MPMSWLRARPRGRGVGGVVSGEEVGEGNNSVALGSLQEGAGVSRELVGK